MRRALAVARHTPPGDIPVGAVIFDADGHELASGTNRREVDGDPTAHAEVVALRKAVRAHGDGWRLTGCEIVVTLEPCLMCAGAILNAQMASLVYGATEPKTGACGSVHDVTYGRLAVRGGVLAEESGRLLTTFFTGVRLNKETIHQAIDQVEHKLAGRWGNP